jgi:hypothetical protein
MNGVEFDTDRVHQLQKMAMAGNQPASSSKFASWLMAKGIVKDEAGAQKVLVGIVICNIILTIILARMFL